VGEMINMRKILICIPALGLGGAEEIVVRLCNYFSKSDNVTLLVFQRCNQDVRRIEKLNKNVSLVQVFKKTYDSLSWQFRVRNLIIYFLFLPLAVLLFIKNRIWQYQIVHLNLSSASLYGSIWYVLAKGSFTKVRFIQTFHTNIHLLNWVSRIIFQISWNFVDKIIVEIDPNELVKISRVTLNKNISFIPFAVAPYESPKPQRLPQEEIVLGTLARLRIKEKKFDVIIESLQGLKQREIPFRYLIGGDGPDRHLIEAMINRAGIGGHVQFCGFIKEAYAFLNEIDLLIVATVGEDTGIAGLQALSIDVPFVGINTLNSFTVDENSPVRISQTKNELVDNIVALNDKRDREDYLRDLKKHKIRQIDDVEMMQAYCDCFSDIK
jgi:glycosyltransferase involved in cell wall biosynthesis